MVKSVNNPHSSKLHNMMNYNIQERFDEEDDQKNLQISQDHGYLDHSRQFQN